MHANTYLNFDGNAEEAFNFYRSVFGGEFLALMRVSEAPGCENFPASEQQRLMHISLRIGKNTVLMASDILPSVGQQLNIGNNVHISLSPESREQADKLFEGLSRGGAVEMPMEDQFWGSYFGSFSDKFGIRWMINYDTMT